MYERWLEHFAVVEGFRDAAGRVGDGKRLVRHEGGGWYRCGLRHQERDSELTLECERHFCPRVEGATVELLRVTQTVEEEP